MHRLINISEANSIAIHSLTLISKLETNVNANQIAKLTGFSKNHVSKILQILVKHRYLNSSRGPKGGFFLIKEADKINLLEIFELFEGKFELHDCEIHNPVCPFKDCIFGDIVKEIQETFIESFVTRKISDIEWKEGVTKEDMLEELFNS